MYKRIIDIERKLDEGMFLFGARQTGKSTLLKERFSGAIYYDLLNPSVRRAFKLNPNSFWEALQDKPAGTLVIVDEIQKVPELLDVVHSLIPKWLQCEETQTLRCQHTWWSSHTRNALSSCVAGSY